MAEEPLLDLDTLIVRPAIVIDGERYEILHPNEMSVLASHRIGRRGQRIDELTVSPEDGAAGELDELVDTVAREVAVGVPATVFEKLSGTHKLAIVDVFTGLLMRSKLGVAGAMAKALNQLPIGEKPSPAYSASSAAGPTGGWWTRLRRWFGRI